MAWLTCLYRPTTIKAMNDNMHNPDAVASGRPSRLFYGWWILVACSLLAIFGGAVSNSQTLFIVPMRDDFNFRPGSAALTFLYAVAAAALAGLLVGWMADRFGSRPLVLFGGLAVGAGLVLSSLADNYWHFLLTFAVAFAGATVGFSMITLLSTVNQWFSRRRPVAMATLMTMFSLGPAFAPLLVAWEMESVGWRSTLLFLGVFLCALTALVCLALRSRPEDVGLWPDGEAAPPSAPDFTVREALRTGAFWALVLSGMVLKDAGSTTVDDITPIMTVAMPLLTILLTFGMGVAAGKIPPRKILSGGLIIGALGHMALLILDNDVGTVAFLAAVAVVQGGSAVYWIMAGDYFGRSKFASLMGLLLLLRAVVLIVPSVIVVLLERTGHYDISAMFYIPLYGAVGVALWFARRPSLPPRVSAEERAEA